MPRHGNQRLSMAGINSQQNRRRALADRPFNERLASSPPQDPSSTDAGTTASESLGPYVSAPPVQPVTESQWSPVSDGPTQASRSFAFESEHESYGPVARYWRRLCLRAEHLAEERLLLIDQLNSSLEHQKIITKEIEECKTELRGRLEALENSTRDLQRYAEELSEQISDATDAYKANFISRVISEVQPHLQAAYEEVNTRVTQHITVHDYALASQARAHAEEIAARDAAIMKLNQELIRARAAAASPAKLIARIAPTSATTTYNISANDVRLDHSRASERADTLQDELSDLTRMMQELDVD